MNKYTFAILPIYLALSNCATAPTSAPDEVVTSVQNGYQIETSASQYAYPNGIRVKPVENGLQVTGRVSHQVHQAIRIPGHVDVELLDTQDQIIKKVSVVPLRRWVISANSKGRPNHEYSRYFSVIIPSMVSNEYRIRVQHHVGAE